MITLKKSWLSTLSAWSTDLVIVVMGAVDWKMSFTQTWMRNNMTLKFLAIVFVLYTMAVIQFHKMAITLNEEKIETLEVLVEELRVIEIEKIELTEERESKDARQ